MTRKLYTVLDLKADCADPVSCKSDEEAIRSFCYFLKGLDRTYYSFSDFVLLRVGEINSVTGVVKGLKQPFYVMLGSDFDPASFEEDVSVEE